MSAHTLMDADTAEPIGPATPEQIEASDEAAAKDGGAGIILVATDGQVISPTDATLYQGARRCYTEVAS